MKYSTWPVDVIMRHPELTIARAPADINDEPLFPDDRLDDEFFEIVEYFDGLARLMEKEL